MATDNAAGAPTGSATPDTGVGGATFPITGMEELTSADTQTVLDRDEFVPDEITQALADAAAEIDAADREAVASLLPNADAIAGQLTAALSDINLTLAELYGSIQLRLDAEAKPILTLVDKIVNSAWDAVTGISAPMQAAGVRVPPDADTMAALLEAEPTDWIGAVVPAFAEYVPKCDAATCDDDTGVGGSGGDPTSPPPPPPPEPPPPPPPPGGDVGGLCPVGYVVWFGGTSTTPPDGAIGCIPNVFGGIDCCVPVATVPPPVPPPEPPPLPPPPVPPPGGGIGGVCCDAPQQIINNITDSTINNTTTTGTGSGTPGQGGGAPFGECPDVNVTVTVPPLIPTSPTTAPPPILDPALQVLSSSFDWSAPDVCVRINVRADAPIPGGADKPPSQWPASNAGLIIKEFTGIADMIGLNAQQVAAKLLPPEKLDYDGTIRRMAELRAAGSLSDKVIESIRGTPRGITLLSAQLSATIAAAVWAERQTGAPLTYQIQDQIYAYQYLSPAFIPGQPGIDALFNHGYIGESYWDCLTRAQGNIPNLHKGVRDITSTRPTEHDIVQLYLRGRLTRKDYETRMVGRGVSQPVYWDDYLILSEQYPGLPDQLRFMVRDSFDEEVVQQYNYDFEFDKKFTDEARKLAQATGIPERFFKLFWRAHWQIPSYTQLIDVLHRFRVDRPERIAWEKENERGTTETDWEYHHRGPLACTIDDIRKALEVNDMAPAWIDALIGIAYRPITNSDAIRAYQIGVYNQDDLYHAFRDNGYDEGNANKLVLFHRSSTERMQSNVSGVLTVRKIISLYKDGALTRFEAEGALLPTTPELSRRQELLDATDVQARWEHAQVMIKAIKKGFMYGKQSRQEAIDAVIGVGGDASRAEELVGRWNDQQLARSKEATAKQLCQWFAHKLLTPLDYVIRLGNLGYDQDDAIRISGVCKTDADWADFKKARSEADRVKREAEKALRDAEARLRKSIKDLTDKKNGLLAQIAALEKQLAGQNSP